MQLTAFYDFDVSAYDYEFLCFLALADVARRKAGCESVQIVFVPATDKPFLGEIHERAAIDWRMSNILLPACGLLPSCGGVASCASRAQASAILERAEAVFPRGYTVSRPIDHLLTMRLNVAAHLGDDVQVLEAGAQARAYVRQWLARFGENRKVVTLSLREAPYSANRNSDPAAWSGFAHRLEAAGYIPVILRDTEYALQPPDPSFAEFPAFPEVAFNLELRAALYEEAYLNAFVANGVTWVASLNKRARVLEFLSGEWRSALIDRIAAIRVGTSFAHFNTHQRLCWGEQGADYLMSEFRTLADEIDADEQPAADLRYREPAAILARRLLRHRQWVELDELFANAFATNPDDGELHTVVGLTEAAKGDHGDAAKARSSYETAVTLLARALDSTWNGAQAASYVEALARLGRPQDAEAWTRKQLDGGRAGSASWALLGRLAEGDGRFAEAEEHYRRAVPTPDVLRGLARSAQERGALDEAIGLYRSAIATGEADPECYENLGLIFEALEQPEGAIEIYLSALRDERANIGCYSGLALLLIKLGERDEAAKILRHFERRGWSDPRLAAAFAAAFPK